MKTRNIATALAFALIGTAALAQDPSYEPLQPITFTKSRADVTAELLQARAETKAQVLYAAADGSLDVTTISPAQTEPVASKTRADVRAEARAAVLSSARNRIIVQGDGTGDRFVIAGAAATSGAN